GVEFRLEGETLPQVLTVVIADNGPGIAQLGDVMDGVYRSRTGMGVGIVGARRLVDRFDIRSEAAHGTRVVLAMVLPREHPLVDASAAAQIGNELAREHP